MLRFSGTLRSDCPCGYFQLHENNDLTGARRGSSLASLFVRECPQASMLWTPNKVTLLRVAVGFLAVSLFGKSAWMNLVAVALTVTAIALDALDGHIARKKQMATPEGAQIDVLGDRIIENMYFTYFAVVGMVSLWLPMFFFARGAATDFLRTLVVRAGHSGLGASVLLQSRWARAIVASRWSRGAYAALKCICFCYLGLELALTRGPVALLGPIGMDVHDAIRAGAQALAWMTAGFCLIRGLPLLLQGWKYFAAKLPRDPGGGQPQGGVA
jgi:CDP-diacylglycerol---glycerol-3-phosphate 3-phosphatidyltransferase